MCEQQRHLDAQNEFDEFPADPRTRPGRGTVPNPELRRVLADQTQLADDLLHALSSRAVIDQTIGIIMAQQRCAATVAFDLLRQASQNRNIKLRELAAEIVEAVGGHPPSRERSSPATPDPRPSR